MNIIRSVTSTTWAKNLQGINFDMTLWIYIYIYIINISNIKLQYFKFYKHILLIKSIYQSFILFYFWSNNHLDYPNHKLFVSLDFRGQSAHREKLLWDKYKILVIFLKKLYYTIHFIGWVFFFFLSSYWLSCYIIIFIAFTLSP